MGGHQRAPLVAVRDRQRHQAGARSRLEPPRAVLDGEHLVGMEEGGKRRQPVELLERARVTLGVGLALVDVLGGDDGLEQPRDPGLAQRPFDLGPQGAGHHAESEAGAGRLAHQLDGAGEELEPVAADALLVVARLARDQPHQVRLLGRPPGLLEGGGETAAVVEAEVPGEVLVLMEREPLLAQDPGEQRLVQRLVIDQNAVEVEQDGAQHEPGS